MIFLHASPTARESTALLPLQDGRQGGVGEHVLGEAREDLFPTQADGKIGPKLIHWTSVKEGI